MEFTVTEMIVILIMVTFFMYLISYIGIKQIMHEVSDFYAGPELLLECKHVLICLVPFGYVSLMLDHTMRDLCQAVELRYYVPILLVYAGTIFLVSIYHGWKYRAYIKE